MKRAWLIGGTMAAAIGAAAAPLPRAYRGAPPVIPHSLDGLTVTREANDCLNCHLEGVEVGEGRRATKIPPSHFTNPHTGETRTDRIVGTRYNCLQCHVPRR